MKTSSHSYLQICVAVGLVLCTMLSTPCSAQRTLSLHEVLESATQRFPKILEAEQKLEQAEARRYSASGAFDVEFQQQSRARTSGYYDGIYAKQKLIKPLAEGNAKVFLEYRLADGDFPVYEDELVTLDKGEVNLGLSFSLLRGREIDKYRLALTNADLDVGMEASRQQAVKNSVQFKAAMAYMEWLNAYQQLGVYRQLLATASARQAAISDRVKLGHAAEIELLDQQQNVVKREAMVLKAQNEMRLRAIDVSFYWRDEAGEPQVVTDNLLPHLPSSLPEHTDAGISALIDDAITRHPDIRQVEVMMAQMDNQRRLYQNELLPQVDVHMKASQDIGDGSETREGFESYVGLEFAMPLQRRSAKGKLSEVRAKIKQLSFLRQGLTESLRISLHQAKAKYVNAKAQAELAERRAELTQRLLQQEQQRFMEGDSDIFKLNLREQHMAEAQISAVTSELERMMASIALLGYAYQMDKLFSP